MILWIIGYMFTTLFLDDDSLSLTILWPLVLGCELRKMFKKDKP